MSDPHDLDARRQAILQSPAYRLAYEDPELLGADDLRPLRLQLELLKPERALREQGVHSTVVVFGSARIRDADSARARLAALERQATGTAAATALADELARARRRVEQAGHYEQARRFAHLISKRFQQRERCDFVVVTGGGPGVMEAGNRGAFDVGAKSVGFNIVLPHEQFPNPYITPGLCIYFHYFATRKMHFLMRAKALVAFPGGYGTLDELFETLTLVQTKKMPPVPIVLFGREFWEKAVDLPYLVEEGTIAPEDVDLVSYAETAAEAWETIARFHGIG